MIGTIPVEIPVFSGEGFPNVVPCFVIWHIVNFCIALVQVMVPEIVVEVKIQSVPSMSSSNVEMSARFGTCIGNNHWFDV